MDQDVYPVASPAPAPALAYPPGVPVVIYVWPECVHPLHRVTYSYPSLGYLRKARGLPPTTPVSVRVHWPPDRPGTSFWCWHCRKLNAQRTAAVQQKYVRMRAAKRPAPQALRHLPHLLGDRFVSRFSLGRFARRHCPPGQMWCSRSHHYVDVADRCTTNSSSGHWCQTCYALMYPHRRAARRLQVRKENAALLAEADRLAHQRDLLRKEARGLRNVIAMLRAEVIVRPHGATLAPEADAAPWAAEPDPAPIPPRRTRDRRKSFST